ncbi:ATP-binding cassette domain-containing protein [Sporolactobacillus sp. STSJ-5]|uniref:ATP-binding cassette domain-containing protein n=1 Tax=Sporolactobacillus sp. STSJ-5 TaxID=2965076 RepID=UPI00210524D6|nr:ATP-binding cassette domain-containing protein [Sporolactobacillus sp. STSJ-5]MCQ2009470.1 ATP-binding cassette domain-containing protein [Sporolactobacillus sp. STSJ-5]
MDRSETKGIKLKVQHVKKKFGPHEVLKNIDLEISSGEFVAIVGKSGCGKSTLLRQIAGLDQPTDGVIYYDHTPLTGLSPDVRIMFQDSRLLPWKRVLHNVSIGMKKSGLQHAQTALESVGLLDKANEWPKLLSGGQQQRVALARSLVSDPRLLLLDEPLGALDALTRIEMQRLIAQIWEEKKFTAVLVTHDVGEAVFLADRVVLIEDGAVKLDKKVNLPRPRTRGSAEFAKIEEEVLSQILEK